MDIRIIIKEDNRIINVTNLSIEVQGKYIVGLTADGKQVLIYNCLDEQTANKIMQNIIEAILKANDKGARSVILTI